MARSKSAKKSKEKGYTPPPIDPQRLQELYEAVEAQTVVTTNSIEECVELLKLFEENGRPLKVRTEWEQKANPWLFLV